MTDETRPILLRAAGLSAGYGRKTVVSDIDLTLRAGERLCVIGPNGSGKTTLLRALAGVLPYQGSLLVYPGGTPVERSRLRPREAARETGLLTQLSSSYFGYSVRETVELGRYARAGFLGSGRDCAADRAAVATALAAVGLEPLAEESLSRLSGGQLQRAFLARALAQEPAILLLDEPTNHLDLRYQLELLDFVSRWASVPGRGAIGVFHDLSLALRFADTVLLLDRGHVADFGPTLAVLGGKAIDRAYGIPVAESMRRLAEPWGADDL